jgi:hypothetical protein
MAYEQKSQTKPSPSATFHASAAHRIASRPHLCIGLVLALGAISQASAGVAFVQGGSKDAYSALGGQVVVTLTWSSAQQAGDLNVISIGVVAGNTITSVMDSAGNSYLQAISAGALGGSEVLYYAANIKAAAAGANTATVTFNGGTGNNVKANVGSQLVGGVSIAEYSGIATTNALDVAAGSDGTAPLTGGTASSGQASTTNANDLLIGGYWAGSTAGTAGTGYTMRTGGIEDQTVTTVGSYSATAQVSKPGGWWVMLVAAFRAVSSGSVCD